MSNFKNKETVIIQNAGNQSVENLIKRGNFALEDKNWEIANSFFEQALNQDPECAEAYLGKLMVEFSISQKEDLANVKKDFSESSNWKRILKYSDEILVVELTEYLNTAKEKIETNIAIKKMKNQKILKIVSIISGIVVSISLIIVLCIFVINPAIKYNKATELYKNEEYFSAWLIFDSLGNYKDSQKKSDLSYKMYEESFWITIGDVVVKVNDYTDHFIYKQGDNIVISSDRYSNFTINNFVGLISVIDGCKLNSEFTVTTPTNANLRFSNYDDTVRVFIDTSKQSNKTSTQGIPITDTRAPYWSEHHKIEFREGISNIKGSYIKNGKTISFTISVVVE